MLRRNIRKFTTNWPNRLLHHKLHPFLLSVKPSPFLNTLSTPLSIRQPFISSLFNPSQFYATSAHMHQLHPDDGFIQVPSKNDLPAYMVFDRPIITSASDTRSYRIIRLQNQLHAIIIHDPRADKAAASMDVNVGHLSDPVNLQGLAHFCEHLLFLGNEKYPGENEYSEYLSKNSGHSNAFTGMDNTVYYFDVHPSALDGALDRFSQFFISPTFTESCTEREIRAVDSENSKNLQNDAWRIFQLDKETSSRSHAYWKFGTGNLKTLVEQPKSLGLNIRDELIKFYSTHYSSNVMNLAVLGRESLDNLTQLVVKKFSLVPNNNLSPDRFDGSPYTENELSKLIFAKMVKDTDLLEMTFPLPDQGTYYDTQPVGFISHHVGHEGPGSITTYLKKKGWINNLSAGSNGGATGFELLKISINLTADGLANYKQIIKVVFAYLDLLRSSPPSESAFREQTLLSEIRFRFRSPLPASDYVTALASWMRHPCPKDEVLSSVYLTNKFDPQLIHHHLHLLQPHRCRILIGTQTPLPGIDYNLKEQWYGTEYTIQDFPEEILKPIPRPEALALPPPNSFIATNFHVDRIDNITHPTRRPSCLSDDQFGRVWHKKDDRWWLPRAGVTLIMRNPIANSNCLNSLKTSFIAKLLRDTLNEQLYEAELAGLAYSINPYWDALIFGIDGYNEKLHLLMETILKSLKNLKVDPQRFQVIKDEVERQCKNFILDGPCTHTEYWMSSILAEVHYTYEEKLALLHDLKVEDIQAFIPQLLSQGFVESLVHGNLTAQEALEISALPQQIFEFDPVPSNELNHPLPRLIPEGCNLIYERPLANFSNINSAVDYYIYIGDFADSDKRTKLSLLSQMMQETTFNRLRTQEQLGYIVRSYPSMFPGRCGLKVVIQSERDPLYVESRIENYLDWFLNEKLATMTQEEFEEMKASLVNNANQDFRNMPDETAHYWTYIKSGYYTFEQKREDALLIQKITKDSMMNFYREFIHPQSSTRAKCSVHVKSQQVPVPSEILTQLFTNQAQFEVSQEEQEEKIEACKPSEEDLNFLQSKPDKRKLIEYLNDKKVKSDSNNTDSKQKDCRIESIISFIEKEYDNQANQIKLTLDQAQLIHPPQIFLDLDKLKSLTRVGPGATPAPNWKDNPVPHAQSKL